MNTLEKIVNVVRINPVAVASTTVGGLLYCYNLHMLLQSEGIETQSWKWYIAPIISGNLMCFSALWIKGFLSYKDIKRGLKTHGITKDYAEHHLKHYCDRQAFKAAAISEDLEEEFNNINRNFPKERKRFAWIPEF